MKKAFLLNLLLLLFIMSAGLCESGAPSWFDCSEDQNFYARTVAELNLNSVAAAGIDGPVDGQSLYGVLLKVENPDSEWISSVPTPEAVVEGPQGRCMIFYRSCENAQTAVCYLAEDENIVYAELDQTVQACSDMEFHSWAAPEMGFDSFVPLAGTYGSGSAEVAVLDSGLFLHKDIKGRVSALGYDYVDGDADPTNDLFGHGTHVTGIVTDCSQGTPVTVYPIRVLDSRGSGKISNLINAVYEAVDRGSEVINLSLTSFSESAALDNALLEAVRMGSTVVLAAGNSASNTAEICPAHMMDAGIIVVASAEGTVDRWERASYSNWGESVDFYAFGSDISSCSRSGGYVTESGTSMAAPHVSAACAMLCVLYPGISPQEIENRLKSVSSGDLLNVLPLVPQTTGISLSRICLDIGDTVSLPLVARPVSAGASIRYSCSDETVVCVENGILRPLKAGSAVISVQCMGFETFSFEAAVLDRECVSMVLPENLLYLSDEVFSNDIAVGHVILPEALVSAGTGVFDGCRNLSTVRIHASLTEISEDMMLGSDQAVLLVPAGSVAEKTASQNGWQYIAN